MSSLQGSSPALGPNGNRMLTETWASDREPTESDRELEIAVFWGDTQIDHQAFQVGRAVAIGSGDGCDVPLYGDEVWEGFQLVTSVPGSSDAIVHVPPGGELQVYREGAERAFTYDAHLAVTDRCVVSLGTTHLVVRWVRPAVRSKSGFFDATDVSFTKVLSIAFLAQLALWLGFWITPLTSERLSEELFRNPDGMVRARPRPPTERIVRLPPTIPSGPTGGTRRKDDEGVKKPEPVKTEVAQKGVPVVDPRKREHDRQKILGAGVLKDFSELGSSFQKVLGSGGLGPSIDDALGGLRAGAGMADLGGLGGWGSRETGSGGGGTGMGIGDLKTKGIGSGANGYGRMGFGGLAKQETRISSGRTVVQGALSKEIIGKVIQRHWNEIKYCYETELNKNPELNGKVAMSFTIDGTGAVSQADVAETTMNNREVEGCIVKSVRRWTFPEPKGGGEVLVTYPWIFKAAGSGDEPGR
jgi:hypothetical protein